MSENPKCSKERLCPSMEAQIDDEPNAYKRGISLCEVTDGKGEHEVVGISYRKSAKVRALMFNVCPWCRASLEWWTPRETKKEVSDV